MSYLIYSFSMIVCSGMFLLLYHLAISRKADYTTCRRYILITMLLSAIIPALNVPLYHKEIKPAAMSDNHIVESVISDNTPAASTVTMSDLNTATEPSAATTQPAAPATFDAQDYSSLPVSRFNNWPLLILLVYLVGLLCCLGLTIRSLFSIRRIKSTADISERPEFTLAQSREVRSPFTFLGTVYIGKDYTDRERSQILCHELSHVRHHHSYEKMAMSLMRSIFWFNPFIWIAEKSLEEAQEWQADNEVMSQGYTFEEYSGTIIRQLFGLSPLATTGMSKSITKTRLIRMKQKESTGHLLAVSALTIVLTSVLFLCFGCKTVVKDSFVNDDDRELPGQPSFIKTEGDYRNYVRQDDRMFFMVDNLIFAKKGDKTLHKHFDEEFNAFDNISRGVDILENPEKESLPTLICINGYKCADHPLAKELKWVNNKTLIVIGTHLATVEQFRSLKPEDYLEIVYYKADSKTVKTPSIVYVITTESIDYTTNYNYPALINRTDADLPEVMSLGGYGVHGDYFIAQGGDYNIAITEHFAIDGKMVSFDEFKSCYKNSPWLDPIVLRNSQAERRFGKGITEIAEFRSGRTTRVHFSNVNGLLMSVINGREHNLSELKDLSTILGISPEIKENDPLTYVEISFDQQNNSWMTDEMVDHIKQFIPWDDPKLIINAFLIKTVQSKPAPEIGFQKYSRKELIPVLPD